MTETISVSVSGAAFSLLLYENVKSEHDQEGFLLGNIFCKETNKLTDADHRVVNKTRTITVKSVIPCPQQFYFYDAAGKVNADKILNLLSSLKETTVVGWYISKRKRPASKLTLREKIIHKQLAGFFCPQISSQISYFSCCLLNSNNSEIRATYSLSQTFLRYHMSKYESLPLHIVNLSDPTYTFKSSEPVSDLLNKTVKAVKGTGETEGHQIVTKVQDSLQEHMKKLVVELTEKELQLFKIEAEVKQLQSNLKLKREYGIEEKEINLVNSQTDPLENEVESSSCIQNSVGIAKKKRSRPKRDITPEKNNDVEDEQISEKEIATPKSRSMRSRNNISYSEMAQKKKH